MRIPALHAQRPLVIVPEVCAVWAQNIRALIPRVSGWWGYQPLLLQLAETAPPAAPQAGTALCSSGGVDSFYTLLRGPTSVDLLICAIGYDVKIRAGNRRNRLEPSIRSVAAETGKRVVVVAPNLRRHRVFRAPPWEQREFRRLGIGRPRSAVASQPARPAISLHSPAHRLLSTRGLGRVYVFACFRFAATRFGAWRSCATIMPMDRVVSPIAARERTSRSIETELSAASIFATRD